MNVFEIIPDEAPIIARQHECQTCFMCELYCPVDALYVSVEVHEAQLIAEGKLGAYSKSLGWKRARAMGTEQDQMDRLFEIGIY
jgi:Fe-S-cluster-containing hydrogenase component 2